MNTTQPGKTIIGAQGPIQDMADEQTRDRKQSLELGRFFEASINDYIKAHGDIKGNIVVAAANWLIELYQERMTGYMLHHSAMWDHLKTRINDEGIKIHTPYENDGLESHSFKPRGGVQQ